jgi:hypothetical protein
VLLQLRNYVTYYTRFNWCSPPELFYLAQQRWNLNSFDMPARSVCIPPYGRILHSSADLSNVSVLESHPLAGLCMVWWTCSVCVGRDPLYPPVLVYNSNPRWPWVPYLPARALNAYGGVSPQLLRESPLLPFNCVTI